MNQQHEILKKYIVGLTKGLGNSLAVVSVAGTGKTETTLETLKEMDYQEGINYRYISNYITPLELFKMLNEVNHLTEPKLLILDDTEDTLGSQFDKYGSVPKEERDARDEEKHKARQMEMNFPELAER